MRKGKKLARAYEARLKDYESIIARLGERAKGYTRPGSRPGVSHATRNTG